MDSTALTARVEGVRRLPDPIVRPEELPGAHKAVPPRALGFSAAALAVATWGALSSPEMLAGYDALSWLLLLIPVFLYAYYRGWSGSTRALSVGSLFVLLFEFAAFALFDVGVEWFFLFLVALVLVAVGLGLGVLSELLHRERLHALAYAYSDPLTGLANRRLLDFMLDKAFADQRGGAFSAVLFGVDGLGEYNARHGRVAGDEALQVIADVIEKNTRRMNTSGRYYGDRFMSILVGAERDGAWEFAENVRETVTALELPTGDKLTVSVGIAPSNPAGRDPEERVKAAEVALERARNLGGDCSVCAGEF